MEQTELFKEDDGREVDSVNLQNFIMSAPMGQIEERIRRCYKSPTFGKSDRRRRRRSWKSGRVSCKKQ